EETSLRIEELENIIVERRRVHADVRDQVMKRRELEKQLAVHNDHWRKLQNELSRLETQLRQADVDVCPTCNQTIDEAHRCEVRAPIEVKINKLRGVEAGLKVTRDELQLELDAVKDVVDLERSLSDELLEASTELNNVMRQVD